MSTFERRVWQIAGLILLVWAIVFMAWLMLTPYPAGVLYP